MILKKFVKCLCEITFGLAYDLLYFVKFNLRYFAGLLNIALPYIMYVLGQSRHVGYSDWICGIELFLPIFVMLVVHYAREFANRYRTGDVLPTPRVRFTQTSADGEVTVEHCRLQELLLYMADLEDWLCRKGLL